MGTISPSALHPHEIFDDYRFAVVSRPDDQKIWHSLLPRPSEQCFKAFQRLGGADNQSIDRPECA